jgi:hypothetical protein
MDNYYISGRKIAFEAGNAIEFDFPIGKTLTYKNKIIVLLDVFHEGGYNQNMFAVSFRGKIVWQVEKSLDADLIGYCPFTSVELNHPELLCFNKCGFRITVNPVNGHITSQVFTK